MNFPGSKKFVFTVIDDTDVSTVENVGPVYELLAALGLRTTKTVWMVRNGDTSSNFHRSETMEDQHYADFVVELYRKGFEIAFHGASMESSTRDTIEIALRAFHETFGHYPRIHANHAFNRDNLYWGTARFSTSLFRWFAQLWNSIPNAEAGHFSGQDPNSEYFWGDHCQEHFSYVRNFCLDEVDMLTINPSMPYHDPTKPFVRRWFSALDAPNVSSFNKLITKEAIDKLERDNGVCIVATHFGKYFVRDGCVNRKTCDILEYIAEKDGWFAPVSDVLDYLASQQRGSSPTRFELLKLELWWLAYRLRARRRDLKPDWAQGES